jgi:hypothetical protein
MGLLKMLERLTISTTKAMSPKMTIPENVKKPSRVLLILAPQQKAMNCYIMRDFVSHTDTEVLETLAEIEKSELSDEFLSMKL